MKNIENKIKKILTEELELPSSYKYMVRNAIYSKQNKKTSPKFYFFKMAMTACVCLIVTTSIVFAKNIVYFIQNFFGNNIGMDTAIENGYIDSPSTDYVESNGTKIKVNRYLMDNYNLNLDLSVKLEKRIQSNKILKMNFADMIITDNNNNILFCQNKNVFDKYCNTHNLDYKWEETNNSYINSGSNYYIKSNENNEINFIYNIYAQNFPKSKAIHIKFNEIILSENEDIEKDTITIKGNWNLEINIPDKFYEREEISYKIIKCNNDKIKLTKAIVSETCTKIELEMEEKPDLPYNLNDDEETKNRKINEFIEWQNSLSPKEYLSERKFKNEYIENEKGQKFYPSKSTDQDSGYSNLEMKYLIYWQTFNLTKYDTTNTLKLFLKYKNEDVIIELEKE